MSAFFAIPVARRCDGYQSRRMPYRNVRFCSVLGSVPHRSREAESADGGDMTATFDPACSKWEKETRE